MVPLPRRMLPIALAFVLGACATAAADPAPSPEVVPDPPAPGVPAVPGVPATTTTTTAPATTTTTTQAWTPGPPPERSWVDFGAPDEPIDPSLFVEYRVRVEPLAGTIALTFDDGPDPEWTPIILDILEEKGVTATFFVLGWKVDAYPEIAKRIVDEGHSLQSHAYRHHNLTKRSAVSVGRLLDDTTTAIQNATGTTPVCVRPPGGITNSRLRATAAAHGQEVVLWTPAGNTADYAHGSRSVVLSRSRSWEPGEVALMHDIWGWIYRDILGQMIDELQERGIEFSTICVLEEIPPTNRLW